MAATQAVENQGDEWDLTRYSQFTMRYIQMNSNLNSLKKFTSSSRSTEFKDILLWSISQMIMKTIPISMRIVILVSQEINKSKWAGLWESQSGTHLKKLTIWVRLFEILEILAKFTRSMGWSIELHLCQMK